MIWIVLIIIGSLVSIWVESIAGKIVFGSVVIAMGFLLLSWITGLNFLMFLAKVCVAIIVVVITLTLLSEIIAK